MNTAFITPNFDNIPLELRKLNRWVTWHVEDNPGEKPRKVPYAPDRVNSRASSTDPDTWGSFDQSQTAYLEGGRTGVGIVLNGDGLVGVDIDHCVTNGVPSMAAMALLDSLGAGYIEISPSGTGLRAIGYGEQLEAGVNGAKNGLKAEFYSTARYLTLTGKAIKTGLLVPLVAFKATAESFRAVPKTKVNAKTGALENTLPDERYAALVKAILSGDVYHDSLRDLAAALVATGMVAGSAVNHLRGLMDASEAPQDERWKARRAQIPLLVSSAVQKFAPPEFEGVDAKTGEMRHPLAKFVSFDMKPKAVRWVIPGFIGHGVVTIAWSHGWIDACHQRLQGWANCAHGVAANLLAISQRPSSLRMMKWTELDLDNALWTIPSMKMKRSKLAKEQGEAHTVPLPTQAVALLRGIHPLTGHRRYVFPGERSHDRSASDNSVRSALHAQGSGKEQTWHGFRASARTTLVDELNIDWQVIEAKLAHPKKDANGTSYNRTKYITQRRSMIQQWADYLNKLAKSADVITLKAT